MSVLLCIVAYLCVGAGCSLYRTYIEPMLFEEERVRDGVTYRSHTFDYEAARVFAFILWPAWLMIFALGRVGHRLEEHGRLRVQRQREIEQQRIADEREVARIIRESRL